MTPEQAAALRAAFPDEQVGKLPKAGVLLDFVGHAAVTDRLLAVDPDWSWEPVAFTPGGEPLIVYTAGNEAWLWIRLTVCGVTRLGVGTASAKAFDLPKQLISDAVRNAAMRFGVALDLWSREDLTTSNEPPAAGKKPAAAKKKAGAPRPKPEPVSPTPEELGFESREHLAHEHENVKELVADLTGDQRDELTEWRTTAGISGWPLPKADLDRVWEKIVDLSTTDSDARDDGSEPF